MSDSESAAPPPQPPAHSSFGGKSIESVQQQQNMLQSERTPYKSWRKKYRKMRAKFDKAFEANRIGFKQEHKLESTARRLREELDELLEILLDLNNSPAIPSDLRFDVRLPEQRARPNGIPPDITPEDSNALMLQYTKAVSQSQIPPLDLHIIRDQIQDRLAAQNVRPLEALEEAVPHPVASDAARLAADVKPEDAPGYLTTDQEAEYLQRLDARMGDPLALDKEAALPPSPHQAELTPRELDRHMDLLNPQSQHNWLKANTKQVDADDTESLASHDSKPNGRKGKGKNLAKQVGDRAVERAYEGVSPSAASGFEEDELGMLGIVEEHPGSGKKKRDPDRAYRVKGGRGGAAKSKRKRPLEEGGAAGSKKPRMSEGVLE